MMAILCFKLLEALPVPVTSTSSSDHDHHGRKTRDNFFPVGRLVLDPVFLCENAGFSLLMEGGPRSYRFNGTLGFICECRNRFKISAEHLTQRLHYDFETGKTHRWMHQFAIGGIYQYLVECPCLIEGVQLGLNYSNAPSKNLRDREFDTGEFNLRRIAGSWSWMFEAGAIVTPWQCARVISSITYNQVHYRRKHQGGKRVSGLGYSLEFTQRFLRDFFLEFDYEYTQAYNNIGGALRWGTRFDCGDLGIGVFANHVFGKRRLPCSTTVGGELTFAFGIAGCNIVPIGPCDYDQCDYNSCCSYDACDLVAWISEPAVYMPQVLAISDEEICTPPTLSGVPDSFISIAVNPGATAEYPTALFFSSGDSVLTFSATGLPAGSFIDPVTGIVTLVNNVPFPGSSGTIFVTATDDCGSQTGSFAFTFFSPPP